MRRSKMLPPSLKTSLPPLFFLFLLTLVSEILPPRLHPIPLQNPSLSNPHLPSLIPTPHLLFLTTILPSLVLIPTSPAPLLPQFLFSLFESNLITVTLTNTLKLLIARPRPYFATVCKSYIPPSNTSCSGSESLIPDARKSFPSGHSSLSFSSAAIVSKVIGTKFKGLISTWQLMSLFIPYIFAGLIASSRLIDYHHHYADVVAGAALGIAVAAVIWGGRKKEIERVMEEELGGGMDEV